MKKSELKQIIKEEIKKVLKENNPNIQYSDYPPGTIAPKDLYYSTKHSKLVAKDDVDSKYHEKLKGWLVVRKGERVPSPTD